MTPHQAISQLSSEDQYFCAHFLEQVLLHSHTNLDGFSDNHLNLIVHLLRSFTNTSVQYRILAALSDPLRHQILPQLTATQRTAIALACDDKYVLSAIFPTLALAKQNMVLKKFYRSQPDLYQFLKTLPRPSTTHQGTLKVTPQTVSHETISPKEAQRLLQMLLSKEIGIKLIIKEAKLLTKSVDPQVTHELLLEIVRLFCVQGINLDSPANCLIYIKFFDFIFYFEDILPDFHGYLKRPYDSVIIGLSRLSDASWIFKVLSQFHSSAILGILTLLSRHGQLSSLEKRTQYSKLFSIIKSQHQDSDSASVRSFFGG
jgi:hypothetical protein